MLSAHLVKLGKLMQERKKDQAQASVLEFFREFGTHVLPGPILWGGVVRSKNSKRNSAWAHPPGWCCVSHGKRVCSGLMLVLSHVLRMCSGMCVNVCASMRACVYVYTRK